MSSPRATPRSLLRGGLLALVGLVLGVVFGSLAPPVHAGGDLDCWNEDQCSFKKPTLLFVVEYSTAMNEPWANQLSRWDVAVDTLAAIVAPGKFLNRYTHVALLRYGHDPDPDAPGTTIPGDASGLVDGVALDLAWATEDHEFLHCNGQALIDSLAATPAPMNGMPQGIGGWTKGALDRAALEIAQSQANHPEDQGETHVFALASSPTAQAAADALAAVAGPTRPSMTLTNLSSRWSRSGRPSPAQASSTDSRG